MTKKIFAVLSLVAVVALSVGFVSCGGDDEETLPSSIMEEEAFLEFESSDGAVYKFHSTYVTRYVNEKAVARLDYEFPDGVPVDMGYGQTTTFNYGRSFIGEFGSYLIINHYTNAKGVPGILYLIHKDLSTYEKKNVLGGPACLFETSLLYVQSVSSAEYEVYDTSMTKVVSGTIQNEGVTKFGNRWDMKSAVGVYNGIYYVLTDVEFDEHSKKAIVNLNTGVATPLEDDDIDDLFPNETNKPKENSHTYSFNKDHFEVIIDIVYYSGDKGTVTLKYGFDGARIGYEIS